LFSTGPVACARIGSDSCSYHSQNGSSPDRVVELRQQLLAKALI
jgi:hypothetical protein